MDTYAYILIGLIIGVILGQFISLGFRRRAK